MSIRSLQKIKHLQKDSGFIFLNKRNLKGSLLNYKHGSIYFCAHTGTSMYPTLNDIDILEIEPYDSRPIRTGDVIFFLSPDGGRPVVHRVVSVIAEGVRTKGDNNTRLDPWIIHPEEVLGRVVRAARGKKGRPIYGGRIGRLWSFGLKGFKALEKNLSFLYHLLARWGLLRRLMPLHKRMCIVALRRKDGRAFQLLLGNWMIGNYQPGMRQWQIRRPFRLFVHIESLPK